jgi:hypothetical protein
LTNRQEKMHMQTLLLRLGVSLLAVGLVGVIAFAQPNGRNARRGDQPPTANPPTFRPGNSGGNGSGGLLPVFPRGREFPPPRPVPIQQLPGGGVGLPAAGATVENRSKGKSTGGNNSAGGPVGQAGTKNGAGQTSGNGQGQQGPKNNPGNTAGANQGKNTGTVANKPAGKTPTAPVKPGKKQQQYYADVLSPTLNNPNVKLNPGQQTAVRNLVNGQPLSADDRSNLSQLLFNGTAAGLSSEQEKAISFALIDDLARRSDTSSAGVSESVADVGNGGQGAVLQNRRFLRIFNNSGERLKVWLQYNVPDAQDEGSWVPADPAKSVEAIPYDLLPGKAYDMFHNKARIAASRVRYWAITPTRVWSQNVTEDLWLATAPDDPNRHSYLDTKVETYLLTFAR